MHPACLDPDAGESLIAACVQAASAVEAARIQAAAAEAAGSLIFCATLIGAMAVIAAAGIAYWAATLERRSRSRAYRLRMQSLLELLAPRVAAIASHAVEQEKKSREEPRDLGLPIADIRPVEDLSSSHWDAHSLMGGSFVREVAKFNEACARLSAFKREFEELPSDAPCDYCIDEIRDTEGGGVTIIFTTAVVAYVRLAEDVMFTLNRLRDLAKSVPLGVRLRWLWLRLRDKERV